MKVVILILITICVFTIAVFSMMVGVLLSNREIKGSCGGIAGIKEKTGNGLCESCETPKEDCQNRSFAKDGQG